MVTPEVVLDFTPKKVPRRRKRSQRDIQRYWATRYSSFIRAGFTDEEAQWGATEGLSQKSAQVRALKKHRKYAVKWYMTRFNYTRAKAVEMAAGDLETKLQSAGITDKNLYYEVSP